MADEKSTTSTTTTTTTTTPKGETLKSQGKGPDPILAPPPEKTADRPSEPQPEKDKE